ncbi:YecA family protein [Aquicella lusitana]|uniref:SEC-C motif-containing protein n=1 Tax=Aquicella lusitana TaxID=254246 RepID=A0A370G5P1_9COXI|nr:SEC-C domain-containing protein [Aquicella lusitana]RDI39075.1 SEC-C motif-containing protein [Aquicella lusitana]VVC73682.1 hypothetical protein AQULUS_14290 [Aquicella lusitana]
MSWEKFTEFMNGFAAANLLMNRAGNNGCFVEYVCLATSVIDALLRTGLILRHQLDTASTEIPTELIFQSDDDKIISERAIYANALEKNILTQIEYEKIENLYQRRNKVVHRYIISEITTDQVLQIANEYQQLIDEISKIIYGLEEEQIKRRVGITVSDDNVPETLKNKTKSLIHEMAKQKHGHPLLSKNLMGTHDRYTRVKIQRNSLCPCGSGKKYKKCCLRY